LVKTAEPLKDKKKGNNTSLFSHLAFLPASLVNILWPLPELWKLLVVLAESGGVHHSGLTTHKGAGKQVAK
jgi:hypothetical protein